MNGVLNETQSTNRRTQIKIIKRAINLENKRSVINKKIELIIALIYLKNKNNPKELKNFLHDFDKSFSDKLYVDSLNLHEI